MLTNHNVLHTLAYLENRQGGGGKLKRAPSQLDEGAMSMLEGRGEGVVCVLHFLNRFFPCNAIKIMVNMSNIAKMLSQLTVLPYFSQQIE